MNLLCNDPELRLLVSRSDERALLARAEIARRLGPRPSAGTRPCATTVRLVGVLPIRCGQWLTERRDVARTLDSPAPITPAS